MGGPVRSGEYALSLRERGQTVVFIGTSAVFPSVRGIRKKKREVRGRKRRKRKENKEKDKRRNSHFAEHKKRMRMGKRKRWRLTFTDVISSLPLYSPKVVFYPHFSDEGGTSPTAMKE